MNRTLHVVSVAALFLSVSAPTSARSAKIRVAVMSFESASTDAEYAALGKGLQAMITTDLNAVGAYELIERARLSDIQAELKLAKTGAINKKTAARIGKLSGASHLLTGTVTILGGKMRIDARMFATQSGKILLAEEITGAKDEFFDLPKRLVKKMVGVTGVKMTPKVRVKVSRVHTADFKAFKTYSDGIAAYDAKQYKKSIVLLKAAAKIDPDFRLANLTLADYEEKIAKMKTLAVTTAVNKRREEEIKRNAGASKEAKEIEGLWEMSRKPGKGAAVERLWGLYRLFQTYHNPGREMRNLLKLEDRFEIERVADALAAQYLAGAQKLFPRVPLLPLNHSTFNWSREPRNERDTKRLYGSTNTARYSWHKMCRRLHLTAKACGQFMVTAAAKLLKAGAGRDEVFDVFRDAGKTFRHALAIDASTVAFSNAQKLTKDPRRSARMVEEVEANRNVKKLLKQCGNALIREALMTDGWSSSWKHHCDSSRYRDLKGPMSPQLARAVGADRTIERYKPLLVGGTPVWIFGHRDIMTGPKTEQHSTKSVVYYAPKPEKYGILSVLGDGRSTTPRVSLETSFVPPPSWYPGRGAYRPGKGDTGIRYEDDSARAGAARPRIVLGVGLVDLDVAVRDNPDTGQREVGRPMRGYGVMLDAAGLHLVEINEDSGQRQIYRTNRYADLRLAWKRVGFKVLKSKPSKVQSKDVIRWNVTVSGKSLKAKVGGKSVSFALPNKLETGYVGLWFDGPGYVHFSKLKR